MYVGTRLDTTLARRICWSALQASFWLRYDARTAPPDTEQRIPIDLDRLGEFEPQPANLNRYGLAVYELDLDGTGSDDGATMAASAAAWTCKHGSIDKLNKDSHGARGLAGLPRFPPGYRLPTGAAAETVRGSEWRAVELPDCPKDLVHVLPQHAH